MNKKLTTRAIQAMKRIHEKITCLTAYDATFARILNEQQVDVILVGDSLGMVIQGGTNTLAVRVQDMIYHSRVVSYGNRRALLMVDMPFMSYNTSIQALGNAARLVSEGGAEVVKLEGGQHILDTVRYLTERGIAVCGHLGLTPQSINQLGGYHTQGLEQIVAERISHDARDLQEVGVSMLVLECVPTALAGEITRSLEIPVIGIGSGNQCDGQILVLQDMLGISDPAPKFTHNFMTEAESVQQAIGDYVHAVKTGLFPAQEHHTAG